jgi:hypothetical protein
MKLAGNGRRAVRMKKSTASIPATAQPAILYPFLPLNFTKWFAILGACLIAGIVLFAADDSAKCSNGCGLLAASYAAAAQIPYARFLASTSSFPIATAVGHALALCLGILGGLLVSLSKLKRIDIAAFRGLGWTQAVLRFGAYALWSAQFWFEPYMNRHQISYEFFESLGKERGLLLLWCAGMYVVSITVTACALADLTIISRRDRS